MSIEDERAIKAVAAMSPSYTVEQALRVQDLAQLGARVLEILRDCYTTWGLRHVGENLQPAELELPEQILVAARSLGLLDEKGGAS